MIAPPRVTPSAQSEQPRIPPARSTGQGSARNQDAGGIPRINPTADILNARNQLSEAFFLQVATGYARLFPRTARRIIEFVFLIQVSSFLVESFLFVKLFVSVKRQKLIVSPFPNVQMTAFHLTTPFWSLWYGCTWED